MDVVSECPLMVGSVLWQPGPEAWTLTVVAKATFRLTPGLSPLLSEGGEDVHEGDGYWDDDELKSLSVATDLVPFKRRPEVVVVGHAHAPDAKPIATLTARLVLGSIDKAVEVRGDQYFKLDGSLSEPARFRRVPLLWERAAGGPETMNPVGVRTGDEARADAWGRITLPNLVPVGTIFGAPRDVIPSIGLAPIAPGWPARVARLHGLVAAFDPERWSESPFPDNFDAAYFNVAPRDQQLTVLDGSESLLLEHLHPRHAALATRLATVRPRAGLEWGAGPAYDIPLACDTLLIDADRGLATLTYRGHLALDHPTRPGRVVVTLDADDSAQVPDWMNRVRDVAAAVARPDGDGDDDAASTVPFSLSEQEEPPTLAKRPRPARRMTVTPAHDSASGPALPFRSGAAALHDDDGAMALPPSQRADDTLVPLPAPRADDTAVPLLRADDTAVPLPASRAAVLPFQARGRLPEVVRAVVPVPPRAALQRSLPPEPPPPPAPALSDDWIEITAHEDDDEEDDVESTIAVRRLDARTPGLAPPGFQTTAQALHIARAPSAPAIEERPFVPPPTSSSEAPAPPPLIGGLAIEEIFAEPDPEPVTALPLTATAAAVASLATAITPAIEPAAAARGLAGRAAPTALTGPPAPSRRPEKIADPPLLLDSHPLERCARIAASLARSPANETAILAAHELDKPLWTRLDAHWIETVRLEVERQKSKLLKAYDQAYVAQLEEERGLLSVDEYAKIVVAAEHATLDAVMPSLSLPVSAAMRIRRVWIGLAARDPLLGVEMRRAIEIERDR